MAGTFLVVDDDPTAPHALADRFEQLGHEVFHALSGKGALETFDRTRPDVVVLTLHSPGPTSTLAYEEFLRRGAALVLLIGYGFAEPDVRAMQLGAEQILTEPMELAHLEAVAARVLQKVRECRRRGFLRVRAGPGPSADTLGPSPEMRALAAQLRQLAAAEGSTVLLTGEPGTGKGRVARIIHQASPRAPAPFVEAGCAAPDAAALAAELFGTERGGDAGGRMRVPGLFELADGGTLFLDEIALLPPELQPDLLAALETRIVRRVGGTHAIRVDVRPILATSHDIGGAVRRGQFRADLFCRLNVVPVHLPAVRERAREDREALARGLFAELLGEMPGSPAVLDSGALERLVAYGWPGNAREMRNVLESALLHARGGAVVLPEHLPPEVAGRSAEESPRPPEPPRGPARSLADVARRHIERTLLRHEGNRTRAAQELGISRATLINKIKVYGLGEVR
jgi:two-component system response regulator AtoC